MTPLSLFMPKPIKFYQIFADKQYIHEISDETGPHCAVLFGVICP